MKNNDDLTLNTNNSDDFKNQISSLTPEQRETVFLALLEKLPTNNNFFKPKTQENITKQTLEKVRELEIELKP